MMKQKIAQTVSNKVNKNNNSNVINNFACQQALNSLNSNLIHPREPPKKARKLNCSKKQPKYGK